TASTSPSGIGQASPKPRVQKERRPSRAPPAPDSKATRPRAAKRRTRMPATSRACRWVSSGREGRRARLTRRAGWDRRALVPGRVLRRGLERMQDRGPPGPTGLYGVPMAVDPFAVAETRYRQLVERRRGGGLDP